MKQLLQVKVIIIAHQTRLLLTDMSNESSDNFFFWYYIRVIDNCQYQYYTADKNSTGQIKDKN